MNWWLIHLVTSNWEWWWLPTTFCWVLPFFIMQFYFTYKWLNALLPSSHFLFFFDLVGPLQPIECYMGLYGATREGFTWLKPKLNKKWLLRPVLRSVWKKDCLLDMWFFSCLHKVWKKLTACWTSIGKVPMGCILYSPL